MTKIDSDKLKRILASNLSTLLNKKKMSQTDLAKELSLPEMTVSNWVNAKTYPRVDKIQLMADFFGVLKSELTEDHSELENKPYYKLSRKEKLDIGKEVDKLIEGMYTDAEVNFYGEPMDEESKDSLRMAIQMAMELNKEKAKKKFTPKKYRDE